MPVKKDAQKAAALAATTPAAFARAIGEPDGKPTRNTLRNKFGVYVSKGDPFDVPLREALYAYRVEHDVDALTRWQDARK
jgi:hypothetical protein